MILDVDYQQRGLTMYVGKVSLFILKFSSFVASQSWGSLIFLLADHLSLSLAINNWLGRLDLAQCKSACFINKEYRLYQNVETYASSANSSLIDCLGIFICSFIIREKKGRIEKEKKITYFDLCWCLQQSSRICTSHSMNQNILIPNCNKTSKMIMQIGKVVP